MLDLHRRTLLRSADLVAAVGGGQWDAPTPCAPWTVRELVTHMIRENRGFAAAARGERADRSPWTSPVGPSPAADYASSVDEVLAAFAAADPARGFWLPYINDTIVHPHAQAVSFHLLDYLVHGWDVAASTGQKCGFAPDIVAAVLDIARREVPDGPRRHRERASFGPPVPVSPEAPAMARVLGWLGRDPGWRPPVV